MARTDAVQFFLELAAEWRRLGAEVTFEPGWERRGNGTSPAYEGGIVHHTGFVSSFANPFPALGTLLNGRPDLRGPLANVGGPVCPLDRPRLHVIAAFPANHAGASGGRSMGPLPVSSLFNRLVVGLEIDYAGLTPMIGGQYRASLIFARGLANVLRRSVEYVRAHGETSVTGKWDIGVGNGRAQTYDMPAFRRDAANYQEDDMPSADDIARAVWEYPIGDNGTGHNLEAWRVQGQTFEELKRPRQSAVTEDGKQSEARMTMGQYAVTADYYGYVTSKAVAGLRASQEELVRTLAAVAKGDTLDVDALVARIDTTVKEAMASTVNVQVSVDGDPATRAVS